MLVRHLADAPVEEWHRLRSHVLMDAGELGSRNMSVIWLEIPGGAEQTLRSHEEAEQVYETALEKDPNYAEAPFSMGVAHLHHGDDKKAVQFLRKAITLNEKYPEAYFCLGVVNNRQQRYRKALEHLKKAVELKPDYAEAYYNMKETYEGLKDFDKAIAVLKKATKLDPSFR